MSTRYATQPDRPEAYVAKRVRVSSVNNTCYLADVKPSASSQVEPLYGFDGEDGVDPSVDELLVDVRVDREDAPLVAAAG
jgi:hypothetical protein